MKLKSEGRDLKSVSAEQLFQTAGLVPTGTVSWGDNVTDTVPGVYVISIADLSNVQYDERFELVRNYWNSDQEIIYIGRSRQLSRRLRQFYKHIYGARSPHRGGQAILLLKCAKLIRWAAVEDYIGTEHRLLEAFEKEVGRKPFGNRVRAARVSEI